MAVEIGLAIAILEHFSLTAVQTRGVVVAGLFVPILFAIGATTTALGRGKSAGAIGFLLALSVPFSLLMVISLLIFGAVTLGS